MGGGGGKQNQMTRNVWEKIEKFCSQNSEKLKRCLVLEILLLFFTVFVNLRAYFNENRSLTVISRLAARSLKYLLKMCTKTM